MSTPILATLCYIRRDGHTLMLHRITKEGDVHEGKWNGLGGKLEPGETPEACAIREIAEESGLVARAPELRGILTFPGFTPERDWYCFVFVVEDFEGEAWTASAEGELHWIPDGEILDRPLWEGDRVFLPWLDGNRFFSGVFRYRDGVLVDHDVVFHGPRDSTPDST
jgi:8-oxo-dGTP diphosphatase